MTYFQNAVCPVCNKPLNEQDDIVVCPECGAPYHRACYKEAGRCVFEDKHAAGFSYLPEPAVNTEPERFVLCPRCGKSNPAGSPACGNCGTRLPQENNDTAPEAPAEPPAPAYRRSKEDVTPDTGKFRPLNGGQFRFGFSDEDDDEFDENEDDVVRRQLDAAQIKPDEKLDGFTLREWLSYLGPSAPVYLFHFKQMDRSRHGRSFSVSAALFAPIYFVYRKMWGWGALALLGKIIYFLPTVLLLLQSAGFTPSLPFTADQLNMYSLYLTYVDLALSVFWGIAAYTLYRRRCIREIARIKQEYAAEISSSGLLPENDEALYKRLAGNGGVSMTGVTVLAAVSIGFYLLMSLFMLI